MKIILFISILFSINFYGQIPNIYPFEIATQEIDFVTQMQPDERVQYLESGNHLYADWVFLQSANAWCLGKGNGTGYPEYYSFARYYRDVDLDNIGNEDEYVYFRKYALVETYQNEYGTYFARQFEFYETNYNFENNNIYFAVDNGNDTFIKTISYNFNNSIWVRSIRNSSPNFNLSWGYNQLKLYDCDTNYSNLEVHYYDNDNDGYGGEETRIYKVKDCNDGVAEYYSLNNDDCNDFNSSITTQPVDWYPDLDGDGYGDLNGEIINTCRLDHWNIGKYVLNSDDCDDTNSQYNIVDLTWYADFDNDGFGDENNFIISPCPPDSGNYITNCYFDKCPTVTGTQDGCPLITYDFDNDNKNYVYERTYLNPFQPEQLNTVTTNDVIEQIIYIDGFGRAIQKNNIKFSPLGKDIITHIEYDGNGNLSKQYLSYVSNNNDGIYDDNSLNNTLNYYDTAEFDNTTNPYIESIKDNSPLQKILEIALPGEDWKKENEHTLKNVEQPYYIIDEVRKYNITFTSLNGIAQPHISYNCSEEYYQDNALIKTIVKDQNWSDTQTNLKDNTRELFTDKFGRIILERKFNSQAETPNHDTYYVYDEVSGNLMYVLPPKASDILEGGSGKISSYQFQKQLPWTAIAKVDNILATESQKTLKELKTETTKEVTLVNKYGGQGFVDIIVDFNNDVIVNFDISLSQPMPLINGEIAKLKTEKPLKDQILGELFSVDYHYQLYVQNNALFIKGNGNVTNINISFNTTSQQIFCNLDQDVLNNLCYQYKYDYENKLIEKKLPGKGWEYILYNRFNQPTLTQNAIQRIENEWSFVTYDELGRIAYSGLSKSFYNRSALQILINNNNPVSQSTTSETIGSTDTTPIYYTNNSLFSETGEIKILTINYYDDYVDIPVNVTAPPNDVNGVPISTYTKNLPTVSKIRVLDTNDWITKVSYYDDKGRLIFAADDNPYIEASNNLKIHINFRGQVKETIVNHTKNGNNAIKIESKFDYDRIGRILSQAQSINNNLTEVIFENQYNELGRLETKNVGNKVGQNRLQNIDYKYNILGLLKSMNDVNNLGDDLFAYEINYNNPNDVNATKMYNGNISEVRWKSASNTNAIKSYSYSYDALNRIKGAQYFNSVDQNEDFGLNNVYYDKNGNIYSLERTGTINTTNYDIIDDLSYVYDVSSNKLLAVNDNAGLKGFKDGNNIGDDYLYDLDGKLISDANKSITQITYNHLNQPKIIYFEDSNGDTLGKIEYVYSAYGQKIEKRVIQNFSTTVSTNVTEYAGVFNYGYNVENNNTPKLNYIKHSEGFIEKFNDNDFKYVYQFKDHLGNIRLSYSDTDGNGIIETTEIREEHGYYPFGLKHQNYSVVRNITHPNKFNGKELEQALGLNLYEMDFRLYDQTLGRFMVIDPLAEFNGQVSFSPYAFAYNNPISFNDPSGLCPECPNPDNYSDQEEYRVNGERYVIQGGEWVRDGGNLDEVVIDRLSQEVVMSEEIGIQGLEDEFQFEKEYGDAFLNEHKEYKTRFLDTSTNFSFLSTDTKFNLNGDFALSATTQASYFKQDVSLKLGGNNFNLNGKADFRFLSVNGELTGGVLTGNDGRYGGITKAEIGAYTVKADVSGGFTFLGVEVNVTVGVSGLSAHAGIEGGVYYDASSGKIVITELAHFGFGVGAKEGVNISIPVSWLWE